MCNLVAVGCRPGPDFDHGSPPSRLFLAWFRRGSVPVEQSSDQKHCRIRCCPDARPVGACWSPRPSTMSRTSPPPAHFLKGRGEDDWAHAIRPDPKISWARYHGDDPAGSSDSGVACQIIEPPACHAGLACAVLRRRAGRSPLRPACRSVCRSARSRRGWPDAEHAVLQDAQDRSPGSCCIFSRMVGA